MKVLRDRERMVEAQLVRRGIEDGRVLDAMRAVPRHEFVPPELRARAYADEPLPIGEEQTISQPYMVGLMAEALELRPGERVLEIGTGSGYQAAVLAEMGADVYTIERLPALAARARANLDANGYGNVNLRLGDGTDGWAGVAPFGAILLTAAARELPRRLLGQLGVLGRMVLPIGGDEAQQLVRVWRTEEGLREDYFGGCRFVKMIGPHGWSET